MSSDYVLNQWRTKKSSKHRKKEPSGKDGVNGKLDFITGEIQGEFTITFCYLS